MRTSTSKQERFCTITGVICTPLLSFSHDIIVCITGKQMALVFKDIIQDGKVFVESYALCQARSKSDSYSSVPSDLKGKKLRK